MELKPLIGSAMAVALLGFGVLAGSIAGTHPAAAAQTAAATPTALAGAPAQTKPAPNAPAITAAITQAQAEAAALAASPGNTVDHTQLIQNNGQPAYDVDFANGGGVVIDATTGAVISKEAAGADQGGGHGRGGPGGPGGADQAALAAQAKVTQAQAEAAALAASPGNTVDHSRLDQVNGTVVWDIDFANGGGAQVNAISGAIIANEAAGADHGGPAHNAPPAGSTTP